MGLTVILRGNNPQDRMSALGQKQTSEEVWPMSALPPKADIGTQSWNVCFVPLADIVPRSLLCVPRENVICRRYRMTRGPHAWRR